MKQISFYMVLMIIVLEGVSCIDLTPVLPPSPGPTVKIGLIVSLTGEYTWRTSRYGAELAANEINQIGGILDMPIELVTVDDRGEPDLSAQLAEQLITQDNVAAIIGPNRSINSLAAAPIAQRYGVPMVATTSTNPAVTEVGDYIFRTAFTDTFQGEVMANFARESLYAVTAATLVAADDVYSVGLAEAFVEHFTSLGGNIVAEETYSVGETDFTLQLTVIAAEEPDVVFMPGLVPDVSLAVKQARITPQPNASGITATFLGGDTWDVPELLPTGGAALNGSYFSAFFSADVPDDSAQAFSRAYQTMFGSLPDSSAAMGYDALRLVATAMRRAGSIDKVAVRDELAATRNYRGATQIIRFDEDRNPVKSAALIEIEGGRLEFYDQIMPE